VEGTNDIYAGRTATQLIGDSATCIAAMKAAGCGRVWQTTLLPRTNSTDFFVTTANQTLQSTANEVQRCAYNDYLRGVSSYSTTGTLTNGSAVITAASSLALYGLYPGMTISSTTSGIAGGTTISSIDYAAGTITMSANFTGTTTAGAAITGTTPSVSGTKSADGIIDLTSVVEGAKTRAAGAIRNGGVFLPGLVYDDGTHLTSAGYSALVSMVNRSMLSMN
jgi:hypothetical protein